VISSASLDCILFSGTFLKTLCPEHAQAALSTLEGRLLIYVLFVLFAAEVLQMIIIVVFSSTGSSGELETCDR
jgi:hypothetical protein